MNSKGEFNRCHIPRLVVQEEDEESKKIRMEQESLRNAAMEQAMEDEDRSWTSRKTKEREQMDKKRARLETIGEEGAVDVAPGGRRVTKRLRYAVIAEDWGEDTSLEGGELTVPLMEQEESRTSTPSRSSKPPLSKSKPSLITNFFRKSTRRTMEGAKEDMVEPFETSTLPLITTGEELGEDDVWGSKDDQTDWAEMTLPLVGHESRLSMSGSPRGLTPKKDTEVSPIPDTETPCGQEEVGGCLEEDVPTTVPDMGSQVLDQFQIPTALQGPVLQYNQIVQSNTFDGDEPRLSMATLAAHMDQEICRPLSEERDAMTTDVSRDVVDTEGGHTTSIDDTATLETSMDGNKKHIPGKLSLIPNNSFITLVRRNHVAVETVGTDDIPPYSPQDILLCFGR